MIPSDWRSSSSSREPNPMLATAARLANAIRPSRSRMVTAWARLSRISPSRGVSSPGQASAAASWRGSAGVTKPPWAVDHLEPIRYPCEGQQSLHLRRTLDEHEPRTGALGGVVGPDEDAE